MEKKFKFTNANIKNLPIPEKRIFYYDTEEKGLSLQMTPKGTKSFYLRDRVLGFQLRVKLGDPSYMSVDDARQASRKAKIQMKSGINPIAERKKLTNENTLKDMYEKFVEEKEPYLQERTLTEYKRMWKNHISALGNKKLSQINGDDLKRLHKYISINSGKRCANHCIVFVKTIYNFFIKDEKYTGKNPATAVKLHHLEHRMRYLERDELERFIKNLNSIENSIGKYAIWMLLMTAARRSNVFSMRWQDINLETKTWTIPQTKTGKNVPVALADVAVNILKELKKFKYNDYVFHSATSASGHIVEVRKIWDKVKKNANIKNLHLHDLRHTLATYLVANNANVFVVKRALTHRDIQSSQIYVNLGEEDLRDKLNSTLNKMMRTHDDKDI